MPLIATLTVMLCFPLETRFAPFTFLRGNLDCICRQTQEPSFLQKLIWQFLAPCLNEKERGFRFSNGYPISFPYKKIKKP
jgi:hypothetical protein